MTPRTKPQTVCTSSNLESPGIDGAHFDYGALASTETFPSLTLGTADWEALGFGGHGQQQNELDQSSNDDNIWSSDYSTDHFPTIVHIKEPALPAGKIGTASRLPAVGSAHFGDNTQYLQQLSELNTRLCLQIKLEPSMAMDQIELAAAQILETSTLFLQLVSGAEGPSNASSPNEQSSCYISPPRTANADLNDDHPDEQDEDQEMETGSDSRQRRCIPDTAALLQLVVISMRITELHCCLYSAILDYLRREDAEANSSSTPYTTTAALASSSQIHSGSISIVGVSLTPQPTFQLQLILQICAHYLGNIRTALHGVDGLCNTESKTIPNAQESMTGSVLVRMVMIQDQQKWTQKICGVLAKLREEYGMVVQF